LSTTTLHYSHSLFVVVVVVGGGGGLLVYPQSIEYVVVNQRTSIVLDVMSRRGSKSMCNTTQSIATRVMMIRMHQEAYREIV
jgi:hypothetical protein